MCEETNPISYMAVFSKSNYPRLGTPVNISINMKTFVKVHPNAPSIINGRMKFLPNC